MTRAVSFRIFFSHQLLNDPSPRRPQQPLASSFLPPEQLHSFFCFCCTLKPCSLALSSLPSLPFPSLLAVRISPLTYIRHSGH